ncbi:MAG: TolC family protein [Elusimicrobia bacterium]|nr:TolC family protein [Elusimicrobiota bacterium]
MRRRRLLLLWALLGPWGALNARAQGAPAPERPSGASAALTLMECYRLALEQSENLKAQEQRIRQAGRRKRQALGTLLPDLSFNASEFFQDSKSRAGSDATSNLTRRERPEAKVTLRQPLFSGWREFSALSSFKSERERERYLLDRASTLLFLDVGRTFYLILQLEKDEANLSRSADLIRERILELRERERLGKSRRSEILSAQSQLDAIEAQRTIIGADKAEAINLLLFLTGRDSLEIRLSDDLPAVEIVETQDHLVARAQRRSDLEALRQEIEIKRQAVRAARAAYYPSAGLLGNYYTKRVGAQQNIDWDVLLSLELPLYQGGAARARVAETESQLDEARLNYDRRLREIRLEIRAALLRLRASISRAQSLKSAFEKADESYRLQVEEYRRGLVNNLEVLQALNNMQDRKRDYDRELLQTKLDWLQVKTVTEEWPGQTSLMRRGSP